MSACADTAHRVQPAGEVQTVDLSNGQHISLELVSSIQFRPVYPESASADVVISLLDGRRLTDSIATRNCPVSGTNQLGPIQTELGDIKRIDFRR